MSSFSDGLRRFLGVPPLEWATCAKCGGEFPYSRFDPEYCGPASAMVTVGLDDEPETYESAFWMLSEAPRFDTQCCGHEGYAFRPGAFDPSDWHHI